MGRPRKSKDRNFVTAREYCDMRGLARQATAGLKKAGLMIQSPDGLIDVKATDEIRGYSSGKVDPESTVGEIQQTANFTEARRVRAIFEARQAKLNYEKSAAQVVEAATVQQYAFAAARAVRDALASMRTRMVPHLLPGAASFLEGEIRDVLDDIEKRCKELFTPLH